MNNLKMYFKNLKTNFICNRMEKTQKKINKMFKIRILKTFNYIFKRNFKRLK